MAEPQPNGWPYIDRELVLDFTRCGALMVVLSITGLLLLVDLLQDGIIGADTIPAPWWGVMGSATTYFFLYERRPRQR